MRAEISFQSIPYRMDLSFYDSAVKNAYVRVYITTANQQLQGLDAINGTPVLDIKPYYVKLVGR
jgi:hypothetical protein